MPSEEIKNGKKLLADVKFTITNAVYGDDEKTKLGHIRLLPTTGVSEVIYDISKSGYTNDQIANLPITKIVSKIATEKSKKVEEVTVADILTNLKSMAFSNGDDLIKYEVLEDSELTSPSMFDVLDTEIFDDHESLYTTWSSNKIIQYVAEEIAKKIP